jgi:hypothetical protein
VIGAVTLHIGGRDRIIQGGPFDDYQPPAIGVCLDVQSQKVGAAALLLPLADFSAPSPAILAARLDDVMKLMAKHPALPVYIGCRADIGRTGIMIAALAKIADHAGPLGWVRANYNPDAVETAEQRAVLVALELL